tara:strand:+ start:1601 stop:1864 length:264 start_codon:yes stop_codon:yes gene_type:complete
MREYIYKVIIFAIAVIIVYKFTIGEQISQVTKQIDMFGTPDGRKSIVESLKKEIKKANEKENYLNEEERVLIKTFILKIRNELALNK